MNPEDRNEDERLSRLLAAAHAEAEPALWARARARIESRRGAPAVLAWITRPAALAAAAAVLVVACGISWRLLTPVSTSSSKTSASLIEALENERGGSGSLDESVWPGNGSPRDSGAGS